jgi:hypothetical protein
MKYSFIVLILALILIFPQQILARTTPEDIVNAQKDTYNQKVQSYSAQDKQKLTTAGQAIAQFNKQKTDQLEQLMIRQGEILDEYIHRSGIKPQYETDGIHRMDTPVDVAEYWLTYAHEAVAYQAAKVYVFNLTGESNTKGDINSQINILQSDLNTLRGKVIKSQNIISTLVGGKK